MSTHSKSDDIDQLIRLHLPLVGYAVAELAARIPAHVGRDDLVSAGMLGLFQAARRFDSSRGVEFARFAKTRIRGALIDELRDRDWASRSVRTQSREVEAAIDRVTARLQRSPTANEVAAELGIEAKVLAEVRRDVDRATVLNYESLLLEGDSDELLPSTGVTPETQVLAREQCRYLEDAVQSLPQRLRDVVMGSFFEDQTLTEIAARLGITESRVSQLRTEALELVRAAMAQALDGVTPEAAKRPGRVAQRKAGYYAAVSAASDYRSRIEHAGDAVAERIAASGLGA